MLESDQGGCSGCGNLGGPPWGGYLWAETWVTWKSGSSIRTAPWSHARTVKHRVGHTCSFLYMFILTSVLKCAEIIRAGGGSRNQPYWRLIVADEIWPNSQPQSRFEIKNRQAPEATLKAGTAGRVARFLAQVAEDQTNRFGSQKAWRKS